MEMLSEGKWREEISLPSIPVASSAGSSSSGSLILREYSRESSSHKNGNTKMKTHTVDGARIIANGRVYRQIFEDQVHLVAELDRFNKEKANKNQIQQVRSSRDTKMPSVQNKTQHGFLDSDGTQWIGALPNSTAVANPVLQKQLQSERHWTEKRSDRWQCSQEVNDLPDIVRPAKVGSDIIDRITEKRREKHNETMEEMHQALAQITLRLEPRIVAVCDKLRSHLESNDSIIEELIKRIEDDSGLLDHSKIGLINLWEELGSQSDVRRAWINETDEELAKLEEERIRDIRQTMSDYASMLEKTSHIAPAHLHRLIDDEAMDINNTLLSNRRAYADLHARLLMADVDRERKNRAWWNKRLDDWKYLNTEGAVKQFSEFMKSPDRVSPPSIEKIMEALREEQSALNESRNKLLHEIKDVLSPPKATKTYVYQWNQNVVNISKQIDQTNQNFLKSLFEEYERVSQACLAEMEKMRVQLVSAGACTDEQVEIVIKERCIPLIGERQREFEAKLEEIDKEFEKLNVRASTQLKALFKFSQGIAHIWDRHELGLAGQERKLHERMEASRHSHDMQNQEKEASLDMIMDRMRQEANETGLKDCLKKALEMLEKIRSGYHKFYEHQEHIAKGYPGMIDDEMDSYDRALCRFFGLSKEAEPTKKKSKKKGKATVKRKPPKSTSTATAVSRETSEAEIVQKQTVGDSDIITETDTTSDAPAVGLSTESTALDIMELEGEAEEDTINELVEAGEIVEKEAKIRPDTKMTPTLEEDLVSRAFKEILTTSKGTQFYVLTVAGKYGIPADAGEDGGEHSGTGPGYIDERPLCEAASSSLPSYVDVVNLSEDLLMTIKKQIRQNFLEHLDEWRTESLQRARKVVIAKCEELESELKLRLHLHEPRPRRTEFDVHNVRAAELVLHSERVTRHCKGIVQLLTELRNDFANMNEEHNRLVEQFRADIETMEEVFINATKSTKLVSLVSQLGEEVNKFMNVIRVSLREFRQKLDDKLAMLREANARFIKSFKLFSEGGNFCPEEVDEYRKRLEKMSHKIDTSESGILSDLEGMEKKRLEQAHKISQEFEDRFKHHMVDLLFMEKVARWLTNTQVKVKAEVADSNSQAQKLAQTLINLDRRIDACEHPNVDKESVTPDQLKNSLNDIFQAFHDRSLYLNCVKTQMRPPSPTQQPAPGSGARVVFSEPTPISRAGKQPNEDASINVIKTILKTQRQRNQAPDDSGEQAQEDSAKVRRKVVQSKEGTVRPSVAGGAGLGSNDGMSVAQMVPGDNNSRQPSVQGSHGGAETSLSKRTSRRGSTSTAAAGDGKRAASASRRYVAKNQRLDKKYLVFGSVDPEGMSMEIANEESHFLGRVRRICREALDGMLLAAELYYRQKGARNVTRPNALQDTFDQCADVIIVKLQSYYQQADEYHNNCLQELRDQLDTLERAVANVPRIIIALMSRHILDQCKQDMTLVDAEFEKRAKELENDRLINEENLRPNLGHPNEANRLEGLCSRENSRHEIVMKMNEEHKAQLRHCVGDCGQKFAENLSSLSEQMLLQFDNLLTIDDVERGRKDPTRHPTSELIRRKQAGAPLEDDETKTLIPRGKTTWPGLKLTEFVLDEILTRPGGVKPRSVAAAVVSAKTTMGHNATVEARDLTYLDFRQHFQELLRQIEEQIRQLELSEQRWNENWLRSVQRVRELL